MAEPDPKYPDRSAIPSHGAEQPVLPEPFGGFPAAGPPADAGREAKGPVEWAADLVRELAATGTGAGTLDKVRRAMVARFNDPEHAKKPADSPERHLTAREALALLERDPAVGDLTRQKARAFVETGAYVPTDPGTVHDADRLPPPPKGGAPRPQRQEKKDAPGGTPPGRTDVERAAFVRPIAAGTMPFDAPGERDKRPEPVAPKPVTPPAADPKGERKGK